MDNLEAIEKNAKRSVMFGAVIFSCAVTSYIFWFLLVLKTPISNDPANWGQFGDFVGGLLNPLIAYLAFYWLLTSVRIQKQELKDTRAELVEARKAQEMQARIQLLSSQISGYRVRLENIIANQKSIREDIIYLRENMRSPPYISIEGKMLSFDEAKAELALLLDQSRLHNEMRETVDRHIKHLLEKAESVNL